MSERGYDNIYDDTAYFTRGRSGYRPDPNPPIFPSMAWLAIGLISPFVIVAIAALVARLTMPSIQ